MRTGRFAVWAVCALLFCGFRPQGGAEAAAPRCEGGDSLRSPLYHYTEGIKRLRIDGDTTAARRAFERALALDSGYAPAHYALAERNGAPGRTDHARKAYEADTTNKFYLGLYAQALIFDARYEEALEAYRRLVRLESRNPDCYRMLALLSAQTGRRAEAVAVLDSAEVLFGRNPQLGSLKRHILLEDGQKERALKEAQEMADALPYDPENHLVLGEIYSSAGNDSLALRSFERALALDSTDMNTLITIAEYYNARRDYVNYLGMTRRIFENEELPLDEKVRIFNRFTSDIRFYREFYPQISALARTLAVRYPKEPSVVELYGSHLIASGSLEQALELYKMRLGDEPPRLEYYTMVVDMESYLQHPDSAAYYLDRAVALFPGRPELYLQQGHLAAIARDYERAERHYNEGLGYVSTDSMRSVVWGFLGDLYQQRSQGDNPSTEAAFARRANGEGSWKKWLKRCYAAYEKALRYDGNNVSVLNNYAYFLSLERRDLNRALEMSSRAVAMEDNNPTYLDTHAWVLFQLGRLEEARRYLLQAVSLDGRKSPDLMVHYGDVLAALGENFMAETYWKRALDNGYAPAEIERRITELKNRKEKP